MLKKITVYTLLIIYIPIILLLTYYSFRYTMWMRDIPFETIIEDMHDSMILHLAAAIIFGGGY